ncbi:uncharacterized protein LOC142646181 [Dermatophagoides pteronyssinus]|uniref:uncharacterized protein LOC142646181 n=1 Tax=Dermatophagoides pteronyssinus TaxID=6956 RepID=UPI003F66D076
MERAYVQYVAPDIVDWVIFENDIGTELTASFCLHFNEINQFSLGFYVVFNVFIMENGIPSSQAVSDMLTETIFFRLTGGLIEMAREYIYICKNIYHHICFINNSFIYPSISINSLVFFLSSLFQSSNRRKIHL